MSSPEIIRHSKHLVEKMVTEKKGISEADTREEKLIF